MSLLVSSTGPAADQWSFMFGLYHKTEQMSTSSVTLSGMAIVVHYPVTRESGILNIVINYALWASHPVRALPPSSGSIMTLIHGMMTRRSQ